MAARQSTAPDALRRKFAKNPDGHDRLHITAGMTSCWCLCGKCWQPYPSSSGAKLGRCICHACPCYTGFFR